MGLAFVALGWLLGVVAAAYTDSNIAAALAAAGLLATIFFWRRPRTPTIGWLAWLPLAIVALLLGFWRYDVTIPDPNGGLTNLNGETVTLRGVISEEPQDRATSRLYRVSAREIEVGGEWRSQDGALLMTLPPQSRYQYGDLIVIEGELDTPPSFPDFDYREYLLREGITSLASYPEVTFIESGHGIWYRERLTDFRGEFVDAIGKALPEPEASLASGVLLGARQNIPAELKEDMQATGTSHLVAVSGQNIAILAGLIVGALAWAIGRRPASWFALLAILAYALLVGLQPSVIRAAIMGGLYVLATISGRQNITLIALGYAAAGMTLSDPQVVRDISFQLSFAATLGLTTLAPRLKEVIEVLIGRAPLGRPFAEMLAVTLAAVAFTLPIQAINFGTISVIAPVANVFAVPAFLAVAATAAVAALITLAVPGAAELATWVAWPAAAYMIGVIGFFAEFPSASTEVRSIETWQTVPYYAGLIALAWVIGRLRFRVPVRTSGWTPGPALAPAAGLAVVVAIAVAVSLAVLPGRGDDGVTVTVMDVGQGDAILIEDAAGSRVLVDGGPSGTSLKTALGRNLPFHDRRLDLVVLTHPQQDHMVGLIDLFDSYDVGMVLVSPIAGDTETYEQWTTALANSGLAVTRADRGQRIALDGATLEVLSPHADDPLLAVRNVNEASVVLRLLAGDISYLLTGDLGDEGEAAIIRSGADLETTVLKVGHHGSRFSSTPEFLARVDPEVSLISVGEGNFFGHPTGETLARLSGDAIYRTDEDGDITISTDGHNIWVQTGR